MRILVINKYFYVKGGAERYFFDLAHGLENLGIEIVPFSMAGSRNRESEYGPYFVDEVDFAAKTGPRGMIDNARRVIYYTEGKKRLERLLADTRPDIAHLHNVAHQLSPSILDALREAGIPTVQTLHDYKLVCPTYRFFSAGKPCERCRNGRYYNVVLQMCNKGSLSSSLMNAIEAYAHRWRRTYERSIDLFIAPSHFMRDKVVEFGVDPERVRHMFYAIDVSAYRSDPEPGEYLLYCGRLSSEKGLPTLLRAIRRLPEARLVVAGEGPLRPKLEDEIRRGGLGNVELVGYLSGERLQDAMRGASLVVVPSEWYENSPLTIYESFALGKPVVGAAIGGIPELVLRGETGYLFTPGDDQELSQQLRSALSDRAALREMGEKARALAEREFDLGPHCVRMIDLYGSLTACASA